MEEDRRRWNQKRQKKEDPYERLLTHKHTRQEQDTTNTYPSFTLFQRIITLTDIIERKLIYHTTQETCNGNLPPMTPTEKKGLPRGDLPYTIWIFSSRDMPSFSLRMTGHFQVLLTGNLYHFPPP